MKKIELNNLKYEIITDYKNGLDNETIETYVTEYFTEYDYIVGDWSYGKLRLKGFNDSKNKNCNDINDISKLEEYLKTYCSYDCSYFVLKKIK